MSIRRPNARMSLLSFLACLYIANLASACAMEVSGDDDEATADKLEWWRRGVCEVISWFGAEPNEKTLCQCEMTADITNLWIPRNNDQGDFEVAMIQEHKEYDTDQGFLDEFYVDRNNWIRCDQPARFEVTRRGQPIELLYESIEWFIPEQTNNFEIVVDEVMCDDPLSTPAPLVIETDGIWGLLKIEITSVSYPKENDSVRFRGRSDNNGVMIRCKQNLVKVYMETEDCSTDFEGNESCYSSWTLKGANYLNLSEGFVYIENPWGWFRDWVNSTTLE